MTCTIFYTLVYGSFSCHKNRRNLQINFKVSLWCGSYLRLSSLRSGVWSVLSLVACPCRQSIARLSPALPTTSSTPSRSNATVAVVPAVRKVSAAGEQGLKTFDFSQLVCISFSCAWALCVSPLLKWQRCLCRALSASKKAFFKTLCRLSSSSRASLHKLVNRCNHETFSQLLPLFFST